MLVETKQVSDGQFSFEDMLSSLLGEVGAGGTNWGSEDWFSSALLTSRRSPAEIDVEAFRKFQVALFEATGIRAEVVGAQFGCTRLKVKFTQTRTITRTKDGVTEEVTHDVDVETDDPRLGARNLVPIVIEAIKNSSKISGPLLESGITTVRSETDLDVETGETRSGVAPQVLVNVSQTNVYGPTGVVADRAYIDNVIHPSPPEAGHVRYPQHGTERARRRDDREAGLDADEERPSPRP